MIPLCLQSSILKGMTNGIAKKEQNPKTLTKTLNNCRNMWQLFCSYNILSPVTPMRSPRNQVLLNYKDRIRYLYKTSVAKAAAFLYVFVNCFLQKKDLYTISDIESYFFKLNLMTLPNRPVFPLMRSDV